MQGNSLMRILHIAAFAVSGYASTEGRQCKPFNPLLGETYEADYPDKGLRFYSEKVVFLRSPAISFNSIQCVIALPKLIESYLALYILFYPILRRQKNITTL